MKLRSTSVLAAVAVAVGLAGGSTVGCGFDVEAPPPPVQDTLDDPGVDNVVPLEQSDLKLAEPAG